MKTTRRRFLCSGLLLGLAAMLPAAANDGGMSLDQAVALVRRQSGGRVVGSRTRRDGGRVIHEVRVVSRDGRVRTWRVDAASGRIE